MWVRNPVENRRSQSSNSLKNSNKKKFSFRKFLKTLGPGIITGASDDDPSGIATYTQAGASFGMSTLWTAFITVPLMAAIQEMCARIGIVTSKGLAATIKQYYSKSLLYVMILLSLPAITLNIGADIQGMGAVANMLMPTVPVFAFSCGFSLLMMYVIIQFPYKKIAGILKWLCLSLMLYILVPTMVDLDWGSVLRGVCLPEIKWNSDFFIILVGILGTTISPYLFFWQATMEAEEHQHRKKNVLVDKRILGEMEVDVNLGMIFSNLVMFFIILTAGGVLHQKGVTQINTVHEAAAALEPLLGKLAYLFFALGVIGTGLLAIPVLAGAQSYMLSEAFGWASGLDKKFGQARAFYVTIILSLLVGLSLDFFGISPLKALLYTAVLYGITAPVLIGIILMIANNKTVMGEFTNGKLSNFLGGLSFLFMLASAVALIYFIMV